MWCSVLIDTYLIAMPVSSLFETGMQTLCSCHTLIITLVLSFLHEHCIHSSYCAAGKFDTSKIPWVATEYNLDILCIWQEFFLDIDTIDHDIE